jgi:HPt (histidine-containing phosphotransfer) domain-containing protein
MSASNLFDPGPIAELRALDNGGNELVNNLVDMFEKSVKEMLEQLKMATEKNDLKELSRIAHILKSSSGNLGAVAFSEQCLQMEELILQKHPQALAQVRIRLTELVGLIEPTLKVLKEHVN